jgi:prefoldin subunit 5
MSKPCRDFNAAFDGALLINCTSTAQLVPDLSHCVLKPTPEQQDKCAAVKENLEDTYVKAYVEITRLVSHYQTLVNSTACEDGVRETFEQRQDPLIEKADKLTSEISEKTEKLQSMKSKMQDVENAADELRKQVTDLTAKCQEMEDTVSSLDAVRDSIHIMNSCPGLERAEFHIPLWVGTWVRMSFGPGLDTATVDKRMNKRCEKDFNGARAAETSEIEQHTVEGMPSSNTGTVPLWGTCPNCQGDTVAGHNFRVCWDTGAPITPEDKRTDCLMTGPKIVMCVQDRGNMRVIPGPSDTLPPPMPMPAR